MPAQPHSNDRAGAQFAARGLPALHIRNRRPRRNVACPTVLALRQGLKVQAASTIEEPRLALAAQVISHSTV